MPGKVSFLKKIWPRTLLWRHILFLGSLFFIVQILTAIWILQQRSMEQEYQVISSRAKLFAETFYLLESIPPEKRAECIPNLHFLTNSFSLSEFRPLIKEKETRSSILLKERITELLGMIFFGTDSIYPQTEKTGSEIISRPDNTILFRDTITYDEFRQRVKIIATVDVLSTDWNLQVFQPYALPVDLIRLDAYAAAPFSDGTWFCAKFTGLAFSSVNASGLVVAFVIQFFVLLIGAFFEMRYLVYPLKRIQEQTQKIDLNNPGIITIPPNRCEETESIALSIQELLFRLRRQIRSRFIILASLSHDLKKPVNRLQLLAEELNAEFPELKENQVLQETLAELQNMMSSVISYTRSGKNQEKKFVMDIGETLETLVNNFKDEDKNITLVKADSCKMNLFPLSFSRCINNCIQNALNYGNAEEYPVEVTGTETENTYIVQIRDYGPGIPEEEFTHVFEPFVRLETPGKKKNGNGLGLSIAQNLAAWNKGKIVLSNEHPGLILQVTFEKSSS